MKYIKVNLQGKFKDDFDSKIKKGRIARIDLLKRWSGSSGIACRVTNVYSRPEWWDADWFEFMPQKGGFYESSKK